MAKQLTFSLLGDFQVSVDSALVTRFETETARALLAYLAAHSRQPQLRSKLALLLWGPESEKTGLVNLRSTIRRIRDALDGPQATQSSLLAERLQVQIHPFAECFVDTLQFESYLRAVQVHGHTADEECATCAEKRREAVALYRGRFLADVQIDSEIYEQWRLDMQERYHRMVLHALYVLGQYEYRSGTLAAAEDYARRQLELESWNEEAHRQLMRVLFAGGRRTAALAQYEICRQALAREIDAVPTEETDALYEHILAGSALPAAPGPRGAVNPYKGLQPFEASDAAYFFGREWVTERLIAAVQMQPLVMLVGPSGSGKSSVLSAGVTAGLTAVADRSRGAQPAQQSAAQQDAMDLPPAVSVHWRVARMRPGAEPFGELADAAAAWGGPAEKLGKVADELRSGQIRLAQVMDAARSAQGSGSGAGSGGGSGENSFPAHAATTDRCLLIIDQFEELFALCKDEEVRRQFLDMLTRPLSVETGAVLIAIRADFLGKALLHSELAAALQRQPLMLGAMPRGDLLRAVTDPARLVGVRFEPGLADRLLDDLGDEPGRLSLLEFALALLWDRQQDGWMLHSAYEQLHGVRGALTLYADQVFGALSPAEQGHARSLFLTLVEPAQDIRRTATRRELGEEQWALAHKLAGARLIVTDRNVANEETAELAHEALIREWSRLREWLAEDREFQMWLQRVRTDAERWQASGGDDTLLLQGPRLGEAQRWAAERGEDMSPLLRDFVAASTALSARNETEKAAAAQREIDRIREIADANDRRAAAEARARRRLGWLAAGLALVSLLAVVLAAYALNAEQKATANARVAHARHLAAEAHNAEYTAADLALLLSLESLRLDNSPEARTALFREFDVNPLLERMLHGKPAALYSLAWGPNGSILASDLTGGVSTWDDTYAKQQGLVTLENGKGEASAVSPRGDRYVTSSGPQSTLWDATTGKAIATLDGHTDNIDIAAFNYDGSHLVTWSPKGQVLLWDAATGAQVAAVTLPNDRPVIGPVSADGKILLLGDTKGSEDKLVLWDMSTNAQVGEPLAGHTAAVHSYTVSPDGELLATASFDNSVRIWDAKTGAAAGEPIKGDRGRMLFAAFSPDGKTLATGNTENEVILWDLATRQRLGRPLLGHSNWARVGRFSPDGKTLATGDEDGNVLLWNVTAQQWLRGHSDRLRSLALSPDAKTLVTSGFDGRLIVRDAVTLEQTQVIPTEHEHAILSIAYSPDGKTLASVDAGGGLTLWDTKTWQPRFPFREFADTPFISLDFSPDSTLLASGAFDGNVRVWDVASGELKGKPIPAYDGTWALAVKFAPDGKLIASGGGDGVIKLWDAATHAAVGAPLTGHTGKVGTLAFGEGGKQLMSGSWDSTIRFWDVATGKPIGEPLRGPGNQAWSLQQAAQPGSLLESVSQDGSIAVWDAANKALVGPPLITQFETEEMTAAPDGKRFYMASTDAAHGLGLVIDRDTRPWTEAACAIANRALTPEEWSKYMGDVPYDPVCKGPP